MKLSVRYLIGAAILGGAITTHAGAARADDATDPFAGLKTIGADGLSEQNGRQGVSTSIVTNLLKGTQSFDIESTNNTVDAETMNSGMIGLNHSFDGMNGINNMAVNTGIGANVQNGLIVQINLY